MTAVRESVEHYAMCSDSAETLQVLEKEDQGLYTEEQKERGGFSAVCIVSKRVFLRIRYEGEGRQGK